MSPSDWNELFKIIGNYGFPTVIAVYFMVVFPRMLEKLTQNICTSQKELMTTINGLRSDVQEMNVLVKYEEKLRRYNGGGY